ncbi:MAG: hypothetical protein Kow00123_26220 [Anaerolineales bacterium]
MPVDSELLDILVCPHCRTKVRLYSDAWLICPNPDCRRKYPIVDDIPVMMIEEGDKHIDTPPEQLDITKVSLDTVGKP